MKAKGIILVVILIAGLLVLFFGVKREEAPQISTTVGLDAPEIFLRDQSGKTYILAELRGSVVFINFWASWCQPCVEEMPSIDKLHGQFRNDQRFRMLMVLFRDDPQKAASFLKESRYDLPVLTDPDGRTARDYGVTGVPETYIVDKKGILREKVIGPADWSSPKAVSLITKLLQE